MKCCYSILICSQEMTISYQWWQEEGGGIVDSEVKPGCLWGGDSVGERVVEVEQGRCKSWVGVTHISSKFLKVYELRIVLNYKEKSNLLLPGTG